MLRDDLELGEDGKVPNVLGAGIEVSYFLVREGGDSTLAREAANSLTTFFFLLRYRNSDSSCSSECRREL